MTGNVPLPVAVLVALLALAGATLALLGSIGLLRLKTFYERVHPPTMGTTLGIACMVVASILLFTFTDPGLALYPVLIAVFAVVTTPVTFLLMMRGATHREKSGDDSARQYAPTQPLDDDDD